jgi:ribonuclease Z
MKLVVLGSNGFCPTELGQTACCAIPELGIVLDAGTGLYRMAYHLETTQLDIYLSHSHADHIWGLDYLGFVFLRKWVLDGKARNDKSTIGAIVQRYGESPHMIRVHVAQEDLPGHQEHFKHVGAEWIPLQAAEELRGGGKLSSFSVAHGKDVRCSGFRLEWPGHSMAYVTDTYAESGASYVQELAGVDLLLHECYLPDSEVDAARWIAHSHTTPVAQVAAKAGVARLVLIHLNPLRPDACEPDLDRARSIFPVTEVAFDGMEIEF